MGDLLLYKTKDNTDQKGKPSVYFTCHPDDFDIFFPKVCEAIFAIQDCAIFYTENMFDEIPEDIRKANLEHMNLFVIPVTSRLLTQPNRAMNSDFQFAVEKHIPVMPIMMETGSKKSVCEHLKDALVCPLFHCQ